MSERIPTDRAHLLDEPLYGHLGTVRPDGTVQVNPMWFDWIDGTLRFTHTSKRQKFKNLQTNPSMSYSIVDPDEPTHYLELRGRLVEVIPDPEGEFYVHLARRYGHDQPTAPPDKADRVVLVMSVDGATTQ